MPIINLNVLNLLDSHSKDMKNFTKLKKVCSKKKHSSTERLLTAVEDAIKHFNPKIKLHWQFNAILFTA